VFNKNGTSCFIFVFQIIRCFAAVLKKIIATIQSYSNHTTMLPIKKGLKVISFTLRISAVILLISFGVFWLLDILFSNINYQNEGPYWLACIFIIFGTYSFLWKQIIRFTGFNEIIELEN
jgi:hypothetical protein